MEKRGIKRRSSEGGIPDCDLGKSCGHADPKHFTEFEHPHLIDIYNKWEEGSFSFEPEYTMGSTPNKFLVLDQLRIIQKLFSTKGDQNKVCNANNEETAYADVQAKLDAAFPYYFFLSSIEDSPETHNEPLSITFRELLDVSLGCLEKSFQINYVIDLSWLLRQYSLTGNSSKPLTLLFEVLQGDGDLLPDNVTSLKVKMPESVGKYGHHHTKMSILAYEDNSIRVIVSTANLMEADWTNRTQGLWISPKLPQLPLDADAKSGDSPTHFKADLISYLSAYQLPQLEEWLEKVQRADFSSVSVFLVASVPGTHKGPDSTLWGHRRVSQLLREHVSDPKTQSPWNKWPVIGEVRKRS